jgi:hypothetical protein
MPGLPATYPCFVRPEDASCGRGAGRLETDNAGAQAGNCLLGRLAQTSFKHRKCRVWVAGTKLRDEIADEIEARAADLRRQVESLAGTKTRGRKLGRKRRKVAPQFRGKKDPKLVLSGRELSLAG